MLAKQAGLAGWGFSSVGRAPALQAGCQRFESANLHINANPKSELCRGEQGMHCKESTFKRVLSRVYSKEQFKACVLLNRVIKTGKEKS